MNEEYREEFVDNFTRYSYATQSWIKYSVGDRIKLGSPRWNTSFMKSYGILEGHVGKIVQIKKISQYGVVRWKIYAKNPLWNYQLPEKDPDLMEFYEYEIEKVQK